MQSVSFLINQTCAAHNHRRMVEVLSILVVEMSLEEAEMM